MHIFLRMLVYIFKTVGRSGASQVKRLISIVIDKLVSAGRMTTQKAKDFSGRLNELANKKAYAEAASHVWDQAKGMSVGQRARFIYEVATSFLSLAAFYDIYMRLDRLGSVTENDISAIVPDDNAVAPEPDRVIAELESRASFGELEVVYVDPASGTATDMYSYMESQGSEGRQLALPTSQSIVVQSTTTTNVPQSVCQGVSTLAQAAAELAEIRQDIRTLANNLGVSVMQAKQIYFLLRKIQPDHWELL